MMNRGKGGGGGEGTIVKKAEDGIVSPDPRLCTKRGCKKESRKGQGPDENGAIWGQVRETPDTCSVIWWP